MNQQAIIMVKPPTESRLFICSCALVLELTHHLFVSQAQQMTMQAMAIVSSPVTSPPTSPITSPPMSPLLQHPSSPYFPASPYAVIPPSPYANIPPSPYANFIPTPYAAANIPPSPYPPPTAQQEQTPSQPLSGPTAQPQATHPNPKPQTSFNRSNKTEPGQPKAAAQVSNSSDM